MKNRITKAQFTEVVYRNYHGETLTEIAKDFGIRQSTLSQLKSKRIKDWERIKQEIRTTEIIRHCHNGEDIVMDSYIYARNPRNNPKAKDRDEFRLRVSPWFWTQKYPAPDGKGGDEHRDTKPSELIDLGETSQYFTPVLIRTTRRGSAEGNPSIVMSAHWEKGRRFIIKRMRTF